MRVCGTQQINRKIMPKYRNLSGYAETWSWTLLLLKSQVWVWRGGDWSWVDGNSRGQRGAKRLETDGQIRLRVRGFREGQSNEMVRHAAVGQEESFAQFIASQRVLSDGQAKGTCDVHPPDF